jgi:hypothetical protein
MDTKRHMLLRKRYIPVLGLLVLSLLTISTTPKTPVPPLPSAGQVQDARALAERISVNSKPDRTSNISASWREIESAAMLLSHASPFDHLSVKRGERSLAAAISVPLWFGLWINAEANIPESRQGFPAVSGKVGHVPVPSFVTRGVLGFGRIILGWRGIDVPPLDDMVQEASFSSEGAAARLRIPKDTKFLRTLAQADTGDVNSDEVIARYCGLVLAQQARPDPDFLNHLHRAFTSLSPVTDYAASNRASLLALAMFTVSPNVGKIASISPDRVRGCSGTIQPPLLLGRPDLPKHWALSAALTAIFGSNLSQAMGVWKEVADSGPHGSGFSFVDLSADRSGIAFGKRATAPDQAEATTRALRTITPEMLLPLRALALQEGMDEGQFAHRYVSVDSAQYNAMIARIDQLLNGAR